MPRPRKTAKSDDDLVYERLFGHLPSADASGEIAAYSQYLNGLVEEALAGRPLWSLKGEVFLDEWRQRDSEFWLKLTTTAADGLTVLVRLAPTAKGLGLTGLLVERDGAEVTARDLRQLNLRPLVDRLLAGYRPIAALASPPVRKARPGRPGHSDEHWQAVAERYRWAMQHDPRNYIKRMRESYPESERPSDATVRRWAQTVKHKIEQGEL